MSGRLEVKTTGWVESGTPWRAVCDDGYVDDETADLLCGLLGFAYGRLYYNPATNFLPPPVEPGSFLTQPVGELGCYNTTELGSPRRSLLSRLSGDVQIPARAGAACRFYIGECGDTGPVVGIQCKATPFAPAPPPPPKPPSPSPPPPRPPSYASDISYTEDLEPNFCQVDDSECLSSHRVELRMPAPPGVKTSDGYVWAPLCAANVTAWRLPLFQTICYQVYDYPWGAGFGNIDKGGFMVLAMPKQPLCVPSGPFKKGDFNTSSYLAWATLPPSGNATGASSVQALKPTLSTKPCKELLALECQIYTRR